jgi:DNA-binding transcriptional ArsR family regulator
MRLVRITGRHHSSHLADWLPGAILTGIGCGPSPPILKNSAITRGASEMRQIADVEDPRVAKALAHPVRVRALNIFRSRTASPSEIAEELGLPLTNVSYHVRVLAEYGLIRLISRTPRRGVIEHHYEAIDRVALAQDIWAELPHVLRSAVARARLHGVSEWVASAARDQGFEVPGARVAGVMLTLDESGWQDLSRELSRLSDRAQRIHTESAERLGRSGRSGERAGLVTLLFAADSSERP